MISVPDSDPALAQQDHLLIGTETPGYRLLDLPCKGSMGAVYRAWNIELKRIVALKLSTLKQRDVKTRRRDKQLRNEATNLAQIEHPSIARCYGFGTFDEFNWIEMEWVDGVSFFQLINFVHAPHSPHRIEESYLLEWITSLIDALTFCHHRGIHHLDLKPRNLMLTGKSGYRSSRIANANDPIACAIRHGDCDSVTPEEFQSWCRQQEIRVLDFGIARRCNPANEISTSSGTPAWMAPEQVCCLAVEPSRVDQYGVGGILYACLTGMPPNRSETDLFDEARETLQPELFCHREAPRKLNPHVSRDLNAIVCKCLEVQSKGRYASLEDLREDIRACILRRPVSARPLSIPEKAASYVRRHPIAIGTISLLLVSLSTTLYLLLSLTSAHQNVVKARTNDKETFNKAIEAISTVDRLYLSDPQLNRRENRELATRFKATLFDLYQLFHDRENLSIDDRRSLAQHSLRLAHEQRRRGDYDLAAQFYEATVSQYDRLIDSDLASIDDARAHCLATVDLLRSQALVCREVYCSDSILRRSRKFLNHVESRCDDELFLYAIANHCRLKLILHDRPGARESGTDVAKAAEIINRIGPPSREDEIIRARSLYNLARVSYKGGLNHLATSEFFAECISLYRRLVEQDAGSSDYWIEYAYAIATQTMSQVSTLGSMHTQVTDGDVAQSEIEKLIDAANESYSFAEKIVEQKMPLDPLNNQLLQCSINVRWMIADFLKTCSDIDANFDPVRVVAARQKCVDSIELMLQQQPVSQQAKHDLVLNLLRLALSWQEIDGRDQSLNCLRRCLKVEHWWKLESFESIDKVRLAFVLLQTEYENAGVLQLDHAEFSKALSNVVYSARQLSNSHGHQWVATDPWLVRFMRLNDVETLAARFPAFERDLRELIDLSQNPQMALSGSGNNQPRRNRHVNNDAEDINNPGNKRIAHHRRVEPNFLKHQWQD